MNLQIALFYDCVRPYQIEQFIFADDLLAALDQCQQDVESTRADFDGQAVDEQSASIRFNYVPVEPVFNLGIVHRPTQQ